MRKLEPCNDLKPTAREIAFTLPSFIAEFGGKRGTELFQAARAAHSRVVTDGSFQGFNAWRGVLPCWRDGALKEVVAVSGMADGIVYDWADQV